MPSTAQNDLTITKHCHCLFGVHIITKY